MRVMRDELDTDPPGMPLGHSSPRSRRGESGSQLADHAPAGGRLEDARDGIHEHVLRTPLRSDGGPDLHRLKNPATPVESDVIPGGFLDRGDVDVPEPATDVPRRALDERGVGRGAPGTLPC